MRREPPTAITDLPTRPLKAVVFGRAPLRPDDNDYDYQTPPDDRLWWVRSGLLAVWSARWHILIWLAACVCASLAPGVLLANPIAASTASFMASFNFDHERVLLMNTLLMLAVGGAIVAVPFRRRIPVIAGAMLFFVFAYLRPFLVRVQHPPLGPQGIKQELIPGALTAMTFTLLGIALVSAAIGTAVGSAYGEVVITPLLTLGSRLWEWVRFRPRAGGRQILLMLPRTLLSLMLGALLAYALVLSSAVPTTLLTFGIEGTLYRFATGAHVTGVGKLTEGTVEQGSFTSAALNGAKRTYYIYLPPTYSVAQAQRYPVLYMLHGSPGTPHNWVGAGKGPVTEDALLAAGKMRETIIVTGDGTGPVYTFSEWANSFDRRQLMEDMVVKDLVPYIDQHYRTLADPAYRAIAGNSEGGYGAVNVALHHPEVFGEAMTEGGYFTAEGVVFGSGPGSGEYRAYNSPASYIFTSSGRRALRSLNIVICVGSGDGEYYTFGVQFYHLVLQAGGHATLLQNPGGHSWEIWALELGESMPLLEPPEQSTTSTTTSTSTTKPDIPSTRVKGYPGIKPQW